MARCVSALVVCVLALCVFGVGVASAEGLSPWWGATSDSRPSSLPTGFARDEVQEITASADTGFVLFVEGREIGIFLTEQAFVEFGGVFPEATAANIQAALEVFPAYGAGTVVSGGPVGTAELTVTNAGRRVPKLEVAEIVGEVHASVVSEGRSSGEIIATVQNRGDLATSGLISVRDVLPAGLEAVGVEAIAGGRGGFERGPVVCALATLTCTASGSLPPFEEIEIRISVVVKAGAKTGELNRVSVSGGGAVGTRSASQPIVIGGADRFGFEDWELAPENVGGSIDTQAGSHPFQLTNVVTFNSQQPDQKGLPRTVALVRDVHGELPVGLIGNPTPFAQCTDAQFAKSVITSAQPINECPEQAAVGVATITFNSNIEELDTATAPIFNMVPRAGEPVRFGFKALGIVSAFLDGSVRSGRDYGVTVSSNDITQQSWVLSVKLTFWGVPGDRRHDGQRGWTCLLGLAGCPVTNTNTPPPFLVMPTSCAAAYESTVRGDSWAAEGKPTVEATPLTYRLPEAIDGCNHLPFEPSIKATPDGSAASTPTGLNVDVHVPQGAVLNAESLAESAVKDITVALPEGVSVNPAGGDGLQACSEGLVGFRGESAGQMLFTPALPQPFEQSINFCPDASKIGTARVSVPILPDPLQGAVYLASQNENPFGSLIAMYIVAEDPVSGVLIKLAGETALTPSGQLIARIKNSPQAPFEDAELHFFGGERAPLGTPAHCGTYTTSATFAPWSGNEPVTAQSHFDITSGPNNTPCPSTPLPFSPAFTAGSKNVQAGAFTAFTTTMSREDGNQDLAAITLHMPPGLLGQLSGVKLCSETQANNGSCPPESLIGETVVSAGLGPDPVSVTGGKVYITEKYAGSPFGLAIVNPVKAGPFDLENTPTNHPACDCIIVRARVDVDIHTAQLTISTDPSGPHAIPSIIDGIPVQIKHVNVSIDRPGFTFNPTNCNPLAITGSLTSDQGAIKDLSVPFQITNCAVLAFKPHLTAKTNGKTSRAKGASLSVKLTYPAGPYDANIAKVKVDLPKQLPSKLPTLQKACPAKTFESNPAACPPASIVGHAKATTPVLPVGLEGPAYFVSHGGEAFPDLIIVLQGYGTTVHLVGTTFINEKTGITSSTFKQVPDVPVGTFELTLPQGKYSALAATANLCTTKLAMPTAFTAQNGVVIKTSTPIVPTGCAKHVKAKAKHKAKGKHRKGK